jgi:hypothetical protein
MGATRAGTVVTVMAVDASASELPDCGRKWGSVSPLRRRDHHLHGGADHSFSWSPRDLN